MCSGHPPLEDPTEFSFTASPSELTHRAGPSQTGGQLDAGRSPGNIQCGNWQLGGSGRGVGGHCGHHPWGPSKDPQAGTVPLWSEQVLPPTPGGPRAGRWVLQPEPRLRPTELLWKVQAAGSLQRPVSGWLRPFLSPALSSTWSPRRLSTVLTVACESHSFSRIFSGEVTQHTVLELETQVSGLVHLGGEDSVLFPRAWGSHGAGSRAR